MRNHVEITLEISGICPEQYAPLRDAFVSNFNERDDLGASFALSVEGEMVVDMWAGHLDQARTQAWQQDTLVNVYSSTKTMSALCMLLLVDRGQVSLDAPVADYWPEFAANGKESVLVRHVMSHSAGLAGFDNLLINSDLYDWEKITGLLAAQEPWWPPGTASGYHALTMGYLIGEVVSRVTGKSLGAFFRHEVAEPLNADFHIGVPDSELSRVADMVPPATDLQSLLPDPASIAGKTFASPALNAEDSWTDDWRQAEIPAANGHGNARSVVRAQSVVANGGEAFGVKLMSGACARAVIQPQTDGEDLVLGVPIQFGLGYALNSKTIPLSPNDNAVFWGGWGGSSVVVDLDARICFAYVMNRMEASLLGDMRGYSLAQAVYQC